VVPVDVALLTDEWGKSKLRDKVRILVSPTRPLVSNPMFDIPLSMTKDVGLVGTKQATMNIKIQKSFFLAGEMAFIWVDIDNSNCKEDCTLVVSHAM